MNGVPVNKLLIVFVASVIGCASVAEAANAPDQIGRVVMRQHPFDFVPEVRRRRRVSGVVGASRDRKNLKPAASRAAVARSRTAAATAPARNGQRR